MYFLTVRDSQIQKLLKASSYASYQPKKKIIVYFSPNGKNGCERWYGVQYWLFSKPESPLESAFLGSFSQVSKIESFAENNKSLK